MKLKFLSVINRINICPIRSMLIVSLLFPASIEASENKVNKNGLPPTCNLTGVTISGEPIVTVGDAQPYSVTPKSGEELCDFYRWGVGGGTGTNGSKTQITITWSTAGNKTITYYTVDQNGETEVGRKTVIVVDPCPEEPPTPTVSANLCGPRTLTTVDPGDSDITYYWQGTSSTGTSTANSNLSYTTVGTDGTRTYYIRAYDSSTTCWSDATGITVVEKTLPNDYLELVSNECSNPYNIQAHFIAAAAGTGSGSYIFKWYAQENAVNYFRYQPVSSNGMEDVMDEYRPQSNHMGTSLYVSVELPNGCETNRERIDVPASVSAPPALLAEGWSCNNTEVRLSIGGGTSWQLKRDGVLQATHASRDYVFDDAPPYSQYQARVSNGTCFSPWQTVSIIENITVSEPSVSLVEQFCAGSTPANIKVRADGGGIAGQEIGIYHWYYSNGNEITNNYNNEVELPYDAGGYLCSVKGINSNSRFCFSDQVSLSVSGTSMTSAGSITTGDQSICRNDSPGQITASAPTGGIDHVYQWQQSNNGSSWSDIPSATGENYTPGALTTPTYFQRKVTSCGSVLYTNSVMIDIDDYSEYLSVEEITCTSPTQLLAEFNAPAAGTGTGQYVVTWYSASSGTSFEWQDDIFHGSSSEIIEVSHNAPSRLHGQSLWVGIETPGGCETSRQRIDIHGYTVPTLSSDAWSCNGSQVNIFVAGGSDKQVKVGQNTYTEADSYFQFDDALPYSRYEVRVGESGCYSSWQTVSIDDHYDVDLPTSVVVDPYCESSPPANINVTVTGGGEPGLPEIQYNWYNMSGGLLIEQYDAVVSLEYIAAGYQYEVFAVDGSTGHTCTSSRATLVPTGTSMTSAGTITLNEPSVCRNDSPGQITASAPTGGIDHVYQWQQSLNGSSWTDIPSATEESYTPGALTTPTYFQRKVTSCGSVLYTNSVMIDIDDYSEYLSVEEITCTSPTQLLAEFYVPSAGTGAGNYVLTWYSASSGTSYEWQDNIFHGSSSEIIEVSHNAPSRLHGQSLWVSIETPDGCETSRQRIDIHGYTVPTLSFDAWSCNGSQVNIFVAGGSDKQVKVGQNTYTETDSYFQFDDALPYSRYEVRVGESGCYSSWQTVSIDDHYDVDLPTSVVVDPYCESSPPANINVTVTGGGEPGLPEIQYNWYNMSGGLLIEQYDAVVSLEYLAAGYQYEVFAVDGSTGHTCTSSRATLVPTGTSMTSAGTITLNEPSVCRNDAPGEINASAPAGGIDHAYQWQQSLNGSSWTDIPSATGSSYTPGALTAPTYFQREVTSCGSVLYSNSVMIDIDDYSDYLSVEEITCTSPTQLLAEFNVPAAETGSGYYYLNWYLAETGTDTQWPEQPILHESESEFIEVTREAPPSLHGKSLWVSIKADGCETSRQRININGYTIPTLSSDAWSCNASQVNIFVAGGTSRQVRVDQNTYTETDTYFQFDDSPPYSRYEVRVGESGCYSSWQTVSIDDHHDVDLPTSVIVDPYCEASPPENIKVSVTGGGMSDPAYIQYNWYDISGNSLLEDVNTEFSLPYLANGYHYEVHSVDQSTGHECTSPKETLTILGETPELPTAIGDIAGCKWQRIELPLWDQQKLVQYNWYDQSDELVSDYVVHGLSYNSHQYTFKGYDGMCETTEFGQVTITITNDCDDNLNWVEATSFSETGEKISRLKSYFDLTGRGLQSQSVTFGSHPETGEDVIFASKTLADVLDREVLATMPAPITHFDRDANGEIDFRYEGYFMLDDQDEIYDYTNFDEALRYSPDPVGASNEGTLGWYYSDNNLLEPYAPTTTYPYTRKEYYDDGTGEPKRVAGPGDHHYLGSGNETLAGTFPVVDELVEYNLMRQLALPGAEDLELTHEAVLSISIDANGQSAINIADKGQKVLLTAEGVDNDGEDDAESLNVTCTTGTNVLEEKKILYFYLLRAQTVAWAGTSDFTLTNIITDEVIANPSDELPAGFYKVSLNANEDVTVSYENTFKTISYNFYDNLGRLVSSVSPKGVIAWRKGTSLYDDIDKTTYLYNHQGRLMSMTEPDAGTTRYLYRRDGSIRFSQNAEQALSGRFSYTHYDRSGRPVESGAYIGAKVTFDAETGNEHLLGHLENTYFEDYSVENVAHADWQKISDIPEGSEESVDLEDWVITHYDLPDTEDLWRQVGLDEAMATDSVKKLFTQTFLMGAVSYTENEHMKTWYSYDRIGRVDWMVQVPIIHDQGERENSLDRAFKINYSYDFLGNVKEVAYYAYDTQDGEMAAIEQFQHHYDYDDNQRLIIVRAGDDPSKPLPVQAKYYYYLHGPLKRVELGDNMQGIDYVYTIQGWLKSINHPDGSRDPGKDGISGANASFGKDQFAMTLEYFNGDYTRMGTQIANVDAGKEYFNGNIRNITWRTGAEDVGATPVMYAYGYDDKYQISNADFGTPDYATGLMTSLGDQYRVKDFRYDANGNIRGFERYNMFEDHLHDFIAHATDPRQDSYQYKDNLNQLTSIKGYSEYEYNEIGQLIWENPVGTDDREIRRMDYDITGKVNSVTDDSGNDKVSFAYDDRGFRLMKKNHDPNNKLETWYIRDASGNVLATYEKRDAADLELKETMLYGSGRIGMYRHDFVKLDPNNDYITSTEVRNEYEGKNYQLLPGGSMTLKSGFEFEAQGSEVFEITTTTEDEVMGSIQYELIDHLGNVRIGLMDESSTITFDASMEVDREVIEGAYFENLESRYMDPTFNHTAVGAYSSKLNPADLNHQYSIGPAINLEVSPGDVVRMEVFARYEDDINDPDNVVSALASAIAGSFSGGSPVSEAMTLTEAFSAAFSAGAAIPNEERNGAPKAYLQYIVFNRDMTVAQNGHVMVQDAAKNGWQKLEIEVPIEEIGYLYVYVANESMDNVDVYFDDLEVQLLDAPVTRANDFYPFGLAMKGRSYSSESYRFGYQGLFAELDEETGWNSFELRMFDPRIGRWMVPDPVRQYYSPYLAFGNNPIVRIDADGGTDKPLFYKEGNCRCSYRMKDGTRISEYSSRMEHLTLRYYEGLSWNNIASELEAMGQRFDDFVWWLGNSPGDMDDLNRIVGMVNLGSYVGYNDDPLAEDFSQSNAGLFILGAQLLLEKGRTHKHHVFPKEFKKFFKSKGINIDRYTVEISADTHLKKIHGKGDKYNYFKGKWNEEWDNWIKQNPNADASAIFHKGESMLYDVRLESLPYIKYR